MAATTTLASLLSMFAEETGLGLVIDAGTGGTATITETDTGVSELRGPFTGAKIPIGSPVTVITGGTLGQDSFVSNFSPSTGVVTLSPAITTGATGFIIWEPVVEHGKNVEKAFNRAHQNRVGRWELRPLTFVPDGDLQGTTVTDYWNAAANGTASYVDAQTFPTATDPWGIVGLNRLLAVTSTGATSVTSDDIPVPPVAQTWYFLTAIRTSTTSGTLTLSFIDGQTGTTLTTSVMRGNASNTLTVVDSNADFMVCEGTITVPASTPSIGVKLTLSATGMVAYMAPIIAFPLTAVTFPLPNRIESEEQIGNFFFGHTRSSPGGLAQIVHSEPITTGGYHHWFSDYGDHRSVSFDFTPQRAIWYEEYVSGAAFSALTSTTTFPADHVQKWARFEFYDWLMRREMTRQPRENGIPIPSTWRPLRNAALKAAERSTYEPAMKNIVGRV